MLQSPLPDSNMQPRRPAPICPRSLASSFGNWACYPTGTLRLTGSGPAQGIAGHSKSQYHCCLVLRIMSGDRTDSNWSSLPLPGETRFFAHGRPGYLLFLLAVSLWLGVIFLAPHWRQIGWTGTPFVYFFFDAICHQLPERTFFLAGHPLPVCHRCLGVYVGFWFGLAILPLLPSLARFLLEKPRRMVFFFFPMAIDLSLENSPTSRFGSGLMAAFPTALFAWVALQQLLNRVVNSRKERAYESR